MYLKWVTIQPRTCQQRLRSFPAKVHRKGVTAAAALLPAMEQKRGRFAMDVPLGRYHPLRGCVGSADLPSGERVLGSLVFVVLGYGAMAAGIGMLFGLPRRKGSRG